VALVVPALRHSLRAGEVSLRETVDAKARRYLVEARVRVLQCDEDAGVIEAEVRGDCRIYSTGRDGEGWYCTCAARTVDCSHVRALRLVTILEPREAR
jgi:hypothetical protein